MTFLKTALKILGVFFLVLLLFAAGLVIYKQPRTPAVRDFSGKRMPGGIAELGKIRLGDWDQWVLIRGRNRAKPLLLFLHGGPGMPLMYLAHSFQRPLEEDFLCVQWDRRGAGKSFRRNIPAESLRVSRILADAEELIERLRHRFGKEKIYLVGHSWGSYLGMLLIRRHPEFFHAFISVGQVVDGERAGKIQMRFIRETAERLENQEALEELNVRGRDVVEKWLFKFGGELYSSTSFMSLIWAGIKAPEYGLADIARVSRGSSFSSLHMKYDVLEGPLLDNIRDVKVPVFFFAGRHDYTTPFALIQEYFDILEAPAKELVWFEHSAHFPFFEEPEAFAAALRRVIFRKERFNGF